MRVRGLWSAGLACVCVVAILASVGCKKKPQDHVLAQYSKGEAAIADYDLEKYKSTMMPESLAAMDAELGLAIRATEAEMKKLRPSTMMYVLALRNRQAAQYLKNMKTDDYLVWLMEQGFIVVDAESDIYPYEVSINGNTATVAMGVKVDVRSEGRMRFGRRRGGGVIGLASALVPRSQLVPIEDYSIAYQRVNGVWLSDAEAMAKSVDAMITQAAHEEDMKVHEYLAAAEEESHGSLKEGIWSPPK